LTSRFSFRPTNENAKKYKTTVPIKNGSIVPFPEDLPDGINSTDTPREVEDKLGAQPKSFKRFQKNDKCRAQYEVPPYAFDCVFESANGRLQGMTVSLLGTKESVQELLDD
jgi:hypothetical protein